MEKFTLKISNIEIYFFFIYNTNSNTMQRQIEWYSYVSFVMYLSYEHVTPYHPHLIEHVKHEIKKIIAEWNKRSQWRMKKKERWVFGLIRNGHPEVQFV